MHLLVHLRDQGTVETVDSVKKLWRRRSPVDPKSFGHRFLVFIRCGLYRLPGEGQNGNTALRYRIIGPIQRFGLHLHRHHGQIGRIGLWSAALSTVFSRFNSLLIYLKVGYPICSQQMITWIQSTRSVHRLHHWVHYLLFIMNSPKYCCSFFMILQC